MPSQFLAQQAPLGFTRGDHWVLLLTACIPDPYQVCQVRRCPLSVNRPSRKKPKCQTEPNAVEPPGRPLGLPAVNAAPASGHDTASSLVSESAKPEQTDVPKLDSAAPDHASSDAQPFPSTYCKRIGQAGEPVECIERPSGTSGESLSPFQTVIVVGQVPMVP